jgi:hypothetical protein
LRAEIVRTLVSLGLLDSHGLKSRGDVVNIHVCCSWVVRRKSEAIEVCLGDL